MKKISILFILLFLGATSIFAQASKDNTPLIPVSLGNFVPNWGSDGKQINRITREEIIANPVLSTPPPTCPIMGFTISMLPKGKDFRGPFTVNGDRLTPQIIKILQEVDQSGCRVFIENIIVKCGDKELKGQVLAFVMDITK